MKQVAKTYPLHKQVATGLKKPAKPVKQGLKKIKVK